MWFRWRIHMDTGTAFLSASSFNRANFALDAAMKEAIDKMKYGTVVSIDIYQSKT